MMIVISIVLCTIGFLLGGYTFIKHLKGFNHRVKTPTSDAWLVAVGTLGWSVLLYASLDDPELSGIDVFSHALILIFWVGSLLKVQKHCLRFRKRFKRPNP
ncbi:hypothetical protein [Moraxella bovoculi]|uniref:hypothetical protein n=1 Tax=Moraxella bovoculi TaxID=386891 RepID=UPI0006247FB8|nr:hypothetical protein [Moraxella bovoculi]AKG15629.2 hypothetical protein AAX08_06585 [Moraxella bovoculi]